jgi:ubiquinone/menaquinone biosynthesis C-methylase UbiE
MASEYENARTGTKLGEQATEITLEQRKYYARTAEQYDDIHLCNDPEHNFSATILAGLFEYLSVGSVLDVGSGTGRVISLFKKTSPGIKVVGVEPVGDLRAIGYNKGLEKSELIDGDATNLPFENDSFDIVCAFAVMHHIQDQTAALQEMIRVAKKAVFISDVNIYGQGSLLARLIKLLLRSSGLWPLAFFLKTRGKNYISSAEDGISFSYSVLDSIPQLKKTCRTVHATAIKGAGANLLFSASHAAILAIKDGPDLS